MNEGFERVGDIIMCICLFPVFIILAVLLIFVMLIRALGEFIRDIYDNDMYYGGKE